MDDCLIFGDNKSELSAIKSESIAFLESYRLMLHDQKSQLFPRRNGIKFLGFHLYPDYRWIRRENLIRFKKRWSKKQMQFYNSEIDFEHLKLSLNGWLGYSLYYDTSRLINKLLMKYKFRKGSLNEVGFSFFLPQG